MTTTRALALLAGFADWLLGARCRLGCGQRVFPLDVGLHERLEHAGDVT